MNVIELMQNAIDYIEEHILDELEVEDIAKRAYMSTFHFQKYFSVICGYTLGEYIKNRRLSMAKHDVLFTEDKVIDIALKFLYNSPEGFTRAFYRYYGITPTAARKRKTELRSFDRLSVKSLFKGEDKMNSLQERGYSVTDMGAVYYTKDMDKTKQWFGDILGWYAGIDAKDEEGRGTYGCVLPFPTELVDLKIAHFNGFHMFYGEPEKRTVLFINVKNIEKLYDYVKQNGWDEITDIKQQPWGGKICSLTTIDGCKITFCEPN